MNNRCSREDDANFSCLSGQHVNFKTIMPVCHMSYAGSKWSNSVEAVKLWILKSRWEQRCGHTCLGEDSSYESSRTKAPIVPQQVTNVSKPMQYSGPTPSVGSPGGMRSYASARTLFFFPALMVHKPSVPGYTTYTHTSCFKKAAAPCNQTQNGHNVLWRCCNHRHHPALHKFLSGSCNNPWNKLMPVTAAHAQSLKRPPKTATRGCTFLEHMTTQKGHARASTWTALRH